jgi:gamma-glutamyltranspeptidase/glutathione hydrolase
MKRISRRKMLRLTGQAVAVGTLSGCSLKSNKPKVANHGRVSGDPVGAPVGEHILVMGGNAIDAAIAATLAVCVTSPQRSGIAGYGGHMVIALAGGEKVTSIDFNCTAPLAAREDMYPLDDKGAVQGQANFAGWRAVAVPGTLAGIQLAINSYGTKSFRELVQPAIKFARDGYAVPAPQANTIRTMAARLRKDPGSAKLYLKAGEPLQAGDLARNPDLADLLTTLAQQNSVDAFYRGDIGKRIAEGIQKNGGLITAQDMAAYRAREVTPIKLSWAGCDIYTAPLTSGGLTVLQALTFLKALAWENIAPGPVSAHARLEALRVAWKDRVELLGDPKKEQVPTGRLLSLEYAREVAEKIQAAVQGQKPLEQQISKGVQHGTTNISAVDRQGNMAIVTFTQGGSFGAQVTLDGLGLTLGHGMSRFNPLPGHPNAPGPGKRPLHNMCPTVVLRDGRPVLGVGAQGGVRIPNTIFEVLAQYVGRGRSMEEAMAAPRLHCMGTTGVEMESIWPADEQEYLRQIGFQVTRGIGATTSAVSFNPKSGDCHAVFR